MFYLMDDFGDFYYINPSFNGFPFLEKKKVGYTEREDAEYAIQELRNLCVKNRMHLDDVDSISETLDRLYISTGLQRRRHVVRC